LPKVNEVEDDGDEVAVDEIQNQNSRPERVFRAGDFLVVAVNGVGEVVEE